MNNDGRPMQGNKRFFFRARIFFDLAVENYLSLFYGVEKIGF